MTMTIDELIEKLEKARKMCVGNNPVWISYNDDEGNNYTYSLPNSTDIYLTDSNKVMIEL